MVVKQKSRKVAKSQKGKEKQSPLFALPEPQLSDYNRTKLRTDRIGVTGRASRRKEESFYSADYVYEIESFGPRNGENLISFVKRVAGLKAARILLVKAWKLHPNDRTRCAIYLNVNRHTLSQEIHRIGLTAELLDAIVNGTLPLDPERK